MKFRSLLTRRSLSGRNECGDDSVLHKNHENDLDLYLYDKMKYGTYTLRSLGPKIWNKLPSEMKNSQNLSTFKKSLILRRKKALTAVSIAYVVTSVQNLLVRPQCYKVIFLHPSFL